jgi:hypothetical protein
MAVTHPALSACALMLASLALAACSGGAALFGTSAAPEATRPPPVNLAGRWLFAQQSRGQCRMTFGAAAPAATEGTIAPEGGCPGKFYMSRKWTAEAGSIVMRDHNGKPLAELSGQGTQLTGKTANGEPVTLTR